MSTNTIKAILTCDSYHKESILDKSEEERIRILTKSTQDGGYGLSPETAAQISKDLDSWKVFDQHSNPLNGYFGRAFVKENEDGVRNTLISHQGTNPGLDLLQDLNADAGLGLYYTKGGAYSGLAHVDAFDRQMNEADAFSNRVYGKLQNEGQFSSRIEHTGHSLGGALSQIQAVKNDLPAQSLDSPGTKVVLDHLLHSGDITEYQYNSSFNRILNYGSSEEDINRGAIDVIQKEAFKFTEPFGKNLYLDDVKGHSCWQFIQYFAKQDYKLNAKATVFAARIGDNHICPAYEGDTPHKGGAIIMGSPDVFINDKSAARQSDILSCEGVKQITDQIMGGSNSVFINGNPAARIGDKTAHGGVIQDFGSTDVWIGD